MGIIGDVVAGAGLLRGEDCDLTGVVISPAQERELLRVMDVPAGKRPTHLMGVPVIVKRDHVGAAQVVGVPRSWGRAT